MLSIAWFSWMGCTGASGVDSEPAVKEPPAVAPSEAPAAPVQGRKRNGRKGKRRGKQPPKVAPEPGVPSLEFPFDGIQGFHGKLDNSRTIILHDVGIDQVVSTLKDQGWECRTGCENAVCDNLEYFRERMKGESSILFEPKGNDVEGSIFDGNPCPL